jgi:DmsE family decaheme c-type cytochrome
MNHSRKLICLSVLVLAALFLLTLTSRAGAADKSQAAAPKAAPQKEAPGYVGAETCKGCHEEVFKKFETTPHWKTMTDTRKGPEWQGCEACHGGGADHMAAGGDKTKIINFKGMKSRDVSARCMECHQFSEEHSNFNRTAHSQNDVSCVSCHAVHNAKEKQYLLKARQTQLCFSCHLETKPDFARPFKHRVNEGLIKCTDCHNQHGGFLTRQVRASTAQDTLCFKCHVDKAGPFVWEHSPVKVEGCMACHVPHGSSNPRMLRRSQVNLLCLECHTLSGGGLAPAGPNHDQSQKYQACTLCHTTVHGSNYSNVFFR